MLLLKRRRGERIVIGGTIVVEVVEVRPGGSVRLGVTAPKDVSVHREEIQAIVDRDNAARRANGEHTNGGTES